MKTLGVSLKLLVKAIRRLVERVKDLEAQRARWTTMAKHLDLWVCISCERWFEDEDARVSWGAETACKQCDAKMREEQHIRDAEVETIEVFGATTPDFGDYGE